MSVNEGGGRGGVKGGSGGGGGGGGEWKKLWELLFTFVLYPFCLHGASLFLFLVYLL